MQQDMIFYKVKAINTDPITVFFVIFFCFDDYKNDAKPWYKYFFLLYNF